MPTTKVSQNSFTTGVISPTLMGRVDVAKYYNALSVGENITLMPHGGCKRRAGTRPVTKSHDVSLGYKATELMFTNKIRLFPFVFNIDQKYLIAFDHDLITIIKGDEKIHDLTTSLFTAEIMKKMDIVQYGDTMIIVHPDMKPMKLVRGASETDWTLSEITFTNVPLFDFTNNYIGKRELFKGDGSEKAFVLIYTKPPFTVYVDGVKETAYAYDKDVGKITFTTAPAIGKEIILISGAGVISKDYLHTYENVWGVNRGYPKTVTIHQGRLFFGGTKAKPITVFGSVINDYFNFNLGDGEADMGIWDTVASGTFDDIANIESARTLQVFTESGEYYNPASPITPATSAWRRQTAYGADRQGLIQIDGATYFVDRSKHGLRQFMYSNEEDAYVSPNVALLADHIVKDMQRIAVSRGAKQDIANLVYVVNGDGSISVLNTMRTEQIQGWSHWTTMGSYMDVCTVDEDVYLLVERGSGVFWIERIDAEADMDHQQDQGSLSDKIIADGFNTEYVLKNITSSNFMVYLNDIEVDPQPSYDAGMGSILFQEAPAEFSTIVVIPTDLTTTKMKMLTGAAEHWDFLHKKGNFFYEGKDHPVVSGLDLELDFDKAHYFLQAGFNFNVRLETVNLNIATQKGSIVNERKRLVRVKLNVFETLGITVENVRMADKHFVMSFNHQLDPFTGVKDVYLLGWADQNTVLITQDVPFKFTLLQIETEIKY